MSSPTGEPSRLPPYAAPAAYAPPYPGGIPAAAAPRGSRIPATIAIGFAAAIVLLLLADFGVYAGLLAGGDIAGLSSLSAVFSLIGAALGLGAIGFGIAGIASRNGVVLAGVAVGVGGTQIVGLVRWIVQAALSGL